MRNRIVLQKTALLFIVGIALFPGIIGPLFNIGQFAGGTDNLTSILISGLIPVLFASYFAFLFFKFFIRKLNLKYFDSTIQLTMQSSFFAYCSFLIALLLCQMTDIIIDNLFFGSNILHWSDAFVGLPILFWFALFPCAIATLLYGAVLLVLLKNN